MYVYEKQHYYKEFLNRKSHTDKFFHPTFYIYVVYVKNMLCHGLFTGFMFFPPLWLLVLNIICCLAFSVIVSPAYLFFFFATF